MHTPNLSIPSVIILDILSSLPGEVYVIIGLLLLLLLASFVVPFWMGDRPTPASQVQRLSTVLLEPRRIMASEEALVYNALHLVVRDRYLLLAKVPVRHLIRMHATDMKSRRALWFLTRNILADFVFLHPGSLIPEKVIFFSAGDGETPASNRPDSSVLDLLERAQISVAHLSSHKPYTVEELTKVLELGEEE